MIAVIAFTNEGCRTAWNVSDELRTAGFETALFCKKKTGLPPDLLTNQKAAFQIVTEPLAAFTERFFKNGNTLIFIGAMGIAVRAIAPFAADKLKDPAVLVMDETAHYVIPVLSGHVGGACEMARFLAGRLKAEAVITTATDAEHLFSADVFAVKNQLKIMNREGIKAISSALLDGERITIVIPSQMEKTIEGAVKKPQCSAQEDTKKIIITFQKKPEYEAAATLLLCPMHLVLGIGCRKEKSAEEIENALEQFLYEKGIYREAICKAASIDLKKDEKGILALTRKWDIPFVTFTAQELMKVPGEFEPSPFVLKTTGADNVCERAAIAACGIEGGTIAVGKWARDGITFALAQDNWSPEFDRQDEV